MIEFISTSIISEKSLEYNCFRFLPNQKILLNIRTQIRKFSGELIIISSKSWKKLQMKISNLMTDEDCYLSTGNKSIAQKEEVESKSKLLVTKNCLKHCLFLDVRILNYTLN